MVRANTSTASNHTASAAAIFRIEEGRKGDTTMRDTQFGHIEGMDPVMIEGWDGITDNDITVGLIGGFGEVRVG